MAHPLGRLLLRLLHDKGAGNARKLILDGRIAANVNTSAELA
jgi:hypothetical protein